jgi:hypothetical protein
MPTVDNYSGLLVLLLPFHLVFGGIDHQGQAA